MADVIVGRFALIDLIAKGGSGSVWRAWDSKTKELCAAKVLRQRDSADLMRFVREKGVSFDHPHLLTPYGWGAEDEHVVIAMPLASGGTLESVVKTRGKLAEPAVVVLLDQLLDGLSHIHAEGWIHRDVKPANIMFEPRGRAAPVSRLADFGIAVHETDVRFTHVGMVNGTPGYMAPELFAMAEPVPSHDLYAAGVVAMVALNGPIKLHDGSFRPDELTQYLRGVTPKLSAVIRKLVAAQPEDRYQDADSVRRDLPRVPQGYPLAHADGSPLDLRDTLDPLPADAPGAVRPERPVPQVNPSSLEAIRAGQVQQGFSSGSPSPQTGPQWAGQQTSAQRQPGQYAPTQQGTAPYGAPQQGPGPQQGAGPQSGMQQQYSPQQYSPSSGPRPGVQSPSGAATSHGGVNGVKDRSTLIAVGLGIAAAVVLGVIVAITLLMIFPNDSALGAGGDGAGAAGAGTSSIDAAFAEVDPGQECAEQDEGVIALTPEGDYISCTLADDGDGYAFA
ncbi:MAG: serine/threonine protein kinase [Brachybacterium tyrofermentans]|uniref:non-specific serine/threonine protein kinase n=1 Tax=Brachybacterium tyrofermentans TaxID=47848 RepID=A0ABW0FDA9_9MICO|nr:serine/threonine-protein kinase [Brachybacterium tyrofermentans]